MQTYHLYPGYQHLTGSGHFTAPKCSQQTWLCAGSLSDILPACCLPPVPASAVPGHANHVLDGHMVLRRVFHMHALLFGGSPTLVSGEAENFGIFLAHRSPVLSAQITYLSSAKLPSTKIPRSKACSHLGLLLELLGLHAETVLIEAQLNWLTGQMWTAGHTCSHSLGWGLSSCSQQEAGFSCDTVYYSNLRSLI